MDKWDPLFYQIIKPVSSAEQNIYINSYLFEKLHKNGSPEENLPKPRLARNNQSVSLRIETAAGV